MANHQHLIIPFASTLDAACQAAIKTLQLPNLTRFLQQAEVVHTDSGDEFDFIAPHERVLGLTEQVIVTPCHWSVGIDNIRMENPSDLQLTDSESRELLAAVLPYFTEDGIALAYQSTTAWHASSPLFNNLALASVDRAIGRNVDVWQPPAEQSKSIRRLQNEMQMLLYTHPSNEAREARGLPTVNSFWLSRQAASPVDANVIIDSSLREPALQSDWQSWINGWQAIDKKLAQTTSSASQSGQALQITLCGERHSVRLAEPPSRTLMQKAKRLFQPSPSVQTILESL
jgi:hypothetical protein